MPYVDFVHTNDAVEYIKWSQKNIDVYGKVNIIIESYTATFKTIK